MTAVRRDVEGIGELGNGGRGGRDPVLILTVVSTKVLNLCLWSLQSESKSIVFIMPTPKELRVCSLLVIEPGFFFTEYISLTENNEAQPSSKHDCPLLVIAKQVDCIGYIQQLGI